MKYIDLSLRIYYLLAPTILEYIAIYPRMLSYFIIEYLQRNGIWSDFSLSSSYAILVFRDIYRISLTETAPHFYKDKKINTAYAKLPYRPLHRCNPFQSGCLYLCQLPGFPHYPHSQQSPDCHKMSIYHRISYDRQ